MSQCERTLNGCHELSDPSMPCNHLPCPSIVVPNSDDPYVTLELGRVHFFD